MTDEGYIKFNCQWQQGTLAHKTHVAAILYWRQQLYQHNLIGVDEEGVGFGNISHRVSNHMFIITGSATGGITRLTESHLAMVTQFSLAQNSLTCTGPIKASSESLSHAALYAALPRIKAVVHVHHAGIWQKLRHLAPTTPDPIAYGTPAMARALQALAQNNDHQEKNIIIMGGHKDGIITYGQTLREAANRVLALVS